MKKTLAVRIPVALLLCVTLAAVQVRADDDAREVVTLLFTNDFESAYDPTPAFWRDDVARVGGIAEIASLVGRIRATEDNVFLFDSGDIFTGTLAKLTRGELSFELMITIGYDAMAIGNHEFEYGWQEFARQKQRAPFPVLGANLFYKGTEHPYAQPYTIIERDGIRIGVIGILGQDAATALIPGNISGVDVRDPKPIVARYVRELRDDVDLVVLLTHQGHTAPMQTDDDSRPDIQRDIQVDIDLAGSIDGIDVLFGGHADAGTEAPVVHPRTGTLIMQTYGQGFHLGYLQLVLDARTGEIESFDGRLLLVDSDALVPDAAVAEKLRDYRSRYPDIYEVVGHSETRLNRQYNAESDLGNLFADIVKEAVDADIGLMPSGGLRKDIPAGPTTRVAILDAFPFEDRMALIEMPGTVLRRVLEQGLSLDRGMLQVSGLTVTYDLAQPVGSRIVDVRVGGAPLDPEAIYRVGTIEILAKGGDGYVQVREAPSPSMSEAAFAEALVRYFRQRERISRPPSGRLLPVTIAIGEQ